MTKNEQMKTVGESLKSRNPEWKHDYYKINATFNIAKKEGID